MDRVQNLDGVKVGDQFVVYAQYSRERNVVECRKVTPKCADIGSYRYWIKDAAAQGTGLSYNRAPNLYHATPEILDEVAVERFHRIACYEIRNQIKWDTLPMEFVARIYNEAKELSEIKGITT